MYNWYVEWNIVYVVKKKRKKCSGRNNSTKLRQQKFRLDIRKRFFT